MSNLINYAKREFLAAGYKPIEDSEDGPDKWIQENVLELLSVFSAQCHSRSSAPFCIQLFEKLARFDPLCPLTGREGEWVKVTSWLWQNIRCSHVFKEADGQAYDINGKIFREPNGCCYISKDSRVYITFPYTPVSVYVDVPADAD